MGGSGVRCSVFGVGGRRVSAVLTLVLVVLLPTSCALLKSAPPIRTSYELPVGTTALPDVGGHHISYQLYGKDPVEDVYTGWRGQFTDDVGIAYYDAGVVNGRRAFVLHCPWRAGTGSVSLEQSVYLTKRTPITLRFSIAMRPDVVDKSDGVTFSAFVRVGDQRTQLMREHYASGEWKDFAFDLSPYAGKEGRIIFQTEPGPKNDASFDFSMFGDARVTVVRDADTQAALLREVAASRAYRSTAQSDLAKLANDPRNGVVPSTNDPHHTEVDFRTELINCTNGPLHPETNFPPERVKAAKPDWRPLRYYSFRYIGRDCRIEYRYPLDYFYEADGSTLTGITARVNGGRKFYPFCGGGFSFAPPKDHPKGPLYESRPTMDAELVSHRLDGDRLIVVWRYRTLHDGYPGGDLRAEVTWTFRLVGKALAFTAHSESRALAGIRLGPIANNRGIEHYIAIPYLHKSYACFLRPQNVFVMRCLDWTKSMSSRMTPFEADYRPSLDGVYNPLHEEGYVAVSPELGEVLPNIPHPPSPYLKMLAPKIMLDIWGGSYDDGAALLRTLKGYGVDNAAVIWHNWQRYGYDVKLPDHLPANPAMGGDEAMKRLAAAAREVGYPFALHENYIDFYPDAPSYDPKDVVLNEKGEFSKAWYHPGTKVQSFALKAGRMLHYAAKNSPEIHRRFGTTAAYLDVHTCVPPWHHVDYDPKTELAGAHHLKVNVHRQLFQYERDTHGGPLFGEGAGHFFWAGLVDGVEAQVDGGEDCPLLLDFDLFKLHPQMVNHGMGYYTRWLRIGDSTHWGVNAPTPAQLDKYRATEIAYGHAGFVGEPCVHVPHLVWREHNLVSPVQALYGAAKATEILYEVDGKLVTSSAAAPVGPLDRVRVTYDSGLVVHANLREADWQVGEHLIPQYGFLAQAPDLLACTAKRDGVIVDYAEDAETLFADARTNVYRPWEQGLVAIEPKLKELKDLGDGAFEITYEWAVEHELDGDYTAFVHFVHDVHDDAMGGDGIRFQNDHPPNPPTSKWRNGTVVADGPHRAQAPADQAAAAYDIVIGLYRKDGPRVALRGTDVGSRRILIGRLAVERDAGRIKSLKLLPIDDVRQAQLAQRRLFDERMNTAGKLVDFGNARTDGSFKLYKRRGALTLLPYPRDKEFAVEFDMGKIAPGATVAKVEALDAEGEPLGEVKHERRGTWLVFRAGQPGAAKFVIR